MSMSTRTVNFSSFEIVLDVNLIFAKIWAGQEKQESWSQMCLPGCSEEYMLHVYTYF